MLYLECSLVFMIYYMFLYSHDVLFVSIFIDNLYEILHHLSDHSIFMKKTSISLSIKPSSYKYPSYIRYIYYMNLAINYHVVDFVTYYNISYILKSFSIFLSIPIINNYIITRTPSFYNKIIETIDISITKMCSYILNQISINLFKIDPKINYIELMPYIKKNNTKLLIQFLYTFITCCVFIILESYQYVYISKILKTYYNVQPSNNIETIFLNRDWDKFNDPQIISELYYIYVKNNDNDIPIKEQVYNVFQTLNESFIRMYYIYYIYKLTQQFFFIPILFILFLDYKPIQMGYISILSYVTPKYSIYIGELLYHIPLFKISNFVWHETKNHVVQKQWHIIDPYVYYISCVICMSCLINSWIMFMFVNSIYVPLYNTIYNKLFNSKVNREKHLLIWVGVIIFGLCSNYSFQHIVFLPWIFNVYSYFLWIGGQYLENKRIIRIQNYF